MRVISSVKEMQVESLRLKREGKRIGFVPTMGFLHDGHLSLMRVAKTECDILVVSIFVNPTQFAPNEDFDSYPRDFKRDAALCENENADIIFYPEKEEMYPAGFLTEVKVNKLGDVLCGIMRPTHFTGVATVVAKLFNIVLPDVAVFGQKDAQQATLITRMSNDLNFPIKIIVAQTVREPDGLAMSSRNKYLLEEERKIAPVLFKSLESAKLEIQRNKEISTSTVVDKMRKLIESSGQFIIDYIEILDGGTLEKLESFTGKKILIALAVKLGKTRLIDNIIFEI